MKKYTEWNEYLASEQDAYLDPENCADCDVQFECGGFKVYGQSLLNAYEICTDCSTICILTEADMSDVSDALLEHGCTPEEINECC